MTNPNAPRMRATTALIIAGGLAAGIALARPGDAVPVVTAAADAAAPAQAEVTGGYGVGNSRTAPAAPAPAPAAPASIAIRDFAFAPGTVVAPGAALTVANQDTAPHTLTFNDGSLDTGEIAGGSSVVVTAPLTPGTYEFFCSIHPSMTGSLTVAG